MVIVYNSKRLEYIAFFDRDGDKEIIEFHIFGP